MASPGACRRSICAPGGSTAAPSSRCCARRRRSRSPSGRSPPASSGPMTPVPGTRWPTPARMAPAGCGVPIWVRNATTVSTTSTPFSGTATGRRKVRRRSFTSTPCRAVIDPINSVVVDIVAQPDVLPWMECPNAVDSAGRLKGRTFTDLRQWVGRAMTGTSTCTHLNDTLRSLSDLEVLVRLQPTT